MVLLIIIGVISVIAVLGVLFLLRKNKHIADKLNILERNLAFDKKPEKPESKT